MRKYLLIILLLTGVMLTACGRDSYTYEEEITVHSLSVFARRMYEQVIRQAAADIAAEWKTTHPYRLFELELSIYYAGNMLSENERLRTMLSAGQGYDMFVTDSQPILRLANAGYLANIYTLMDAAPFPGAAINRDRLFRQALAAHEINGSLYVLPLTFGFNYVYINSRLPHTIIEHFIINDTISFCEMMRIHLDIRDLYEYDMYFIGNFWRAYYPYHALSLYIDNFANFADDEFMQFLSLLADVYSRPVTAGRLRHAAGIRNAGTVRNFIDYTFLIDSFGFCPVFAFADKSLINPDAVFFYARPLTDARGRLLLSHCCCRGNVSITSAGNRHLAWEFTQHLIKASAAGPNSFSTHSMVSPILREYLEPFVFDAIGRTNRMSIFAEEAPILFSHIPHTDEETFGSIVARLESYNQRQMAPLRSHIPVEYYSDDMTAFLLDNITPEEFARRLELTVAQWRQ